MSGKKAEMETGYNHDILHKGKKYHIQTEDCGVFNPVVLTHLFLEGVVLDTLKISYSDVLAEGEGVKDRVKELMKKQHLVMIKRAISGHYDGGGEVNEDDES